MANKDSDAGTFSRPETWEEVKELQERTTLLLRAHAVSFAKRKLTQHNATPGQREAVLSAYETDAALVAAAGKADDETTAKRYRRRGASGMAKASALGISVWQWGTNRCSTVGSWYDFRAAMQFYLVEEMVKAKRAIDVWGRGASSKNVPTAVQEEFKKACDELPRLANQLASLPQGLPPEFRKRSDSLGENQSDASGSGFREKRNRRSKSSSLKYLPPEWRERMAARMDREMRLRWLVQCVTGCRSQELSNGVLVRRQLGGHLQTLVKGAKLGRYAGQPTREMLVLAKDGVARELAQMLEVGEVISISSLGAKELDAYRQAVKRLGRRLFAPRRSTDGVTPYSARNQFKADIKKSGLSRPQVAQAMGHSTTRSAAYYGRGVRSRGDGCITPVEVRAARPVRVRAAIPQQAKLKKAAMVKAGVKRPSRRPRR